MQHVRKEHIPLMIIGGINEEEPSVASPEEIDYSRVKLLQVSSDEGTDEADPRSIVSYEKREAQAESSDDSDGGSPHNMTHKLRA